jgi:hypothetical protein
MPFSLRSKIYKRHCGEVTPKTFGNQKTTCVERKAPVPKRAITKEVQCVFWTCGTGFGRKFVTRPNIVVLVFGFVSLNYFRMFLD